MPVGPQFFVHMNRDMDLGQISQRIQTIAEQLQQNKGFVLEQQGKVYEVRPSDPCSFKMVYELMPKGELSVKIELKWWPTETSSSAERREDDLVKISPLGK